MLYFLTLIIAITMVNMFYNRYVSIRGVRCINMGNVVLDKNLVLLDLRDYNEAAKEPINEAYNLPSAYLKRHYRTIKNHDIIILVADEMSKNTGIRSLRRKGFHVVGYSFIGDNKQQFLNKCCMEGGVMNGV
jgi:rhodanese-related sulfurtransferase